MTAFLVFLGLISLTPLAVLAAMWGTDALNRHFWRRYGYCPTCDQLRADEEADA